MEEILSIIIQHASIWAPSLVSIITIVAMIIPVFIKATEWLKGLKEDKTLADISARLDAQAKENAELVRCNKLLLDEITKIKDYADHKKEE